MRAAETITRRLQQGSLSPAWTKTIAGIVDDHSGLREMAEALEWAMGKTNPSPCRCMPFATPPHVCKGHIALARHHGKEQL